MHGQIPRIEPGGVKTFTYRQYRRVPFVFGQASELSLPQIVQPLGYRNLKIFEESNGPPLIQFAANLGLDQINNRVSYVASDAGVPLPDPHSRLHDASSQPQKEIYHTGYLTTGSRSFRPHTPHTPTSACLASRTNGRRGKCLSCCNAAASTTIAWAINEKGVVGSPECRLRRICINDPRKTPEAQILLHQRPGTGSSIRRACGSTRSALSRWQHYCRRRRPRNPNLHGNALQSGANVLFCRNSGTFVV